MGDRLAELKNKYQSVLRVVEQQRVQLKNVHIENDKLLIRGEAPSADAKDQVWDQVKLVDPKYGDLTMDITVSPSPSSDAKQQASAANTYTVQSGDTLSAISKRFYGDAHQYMKIFDANKGLLKDPDKIQPGQKLVIPA